MLIVYNNAIILDTAAAYCMLRVFLYPNVAQYWVKVRPTTRIPKFVSLGYRETPEKIPKLVLLGYRKIPKKIPKWFPSYGVILPTVLFSKSVSITNHMYN